VSVTVIQTGMYKSIFIEIQSRVSKNIIHSDTEILIQSHDLQRNFRVYEIRAYPYCMSGTCSGPVLEHSICTEFGLSSAAYRLVFRRLLM